MATFFCPPASFQLIGFQCFGTVSVELDFPLSITTLRPLAIRLNSEAERVDLPVPDLEVKNEKNKVTLIVR